LALRRRKPREPRPENWPPRQLGPLETLLDAPPTREDDPSLWAVRDALEAAGAIAAVPAVVRETFDQIYDGQRTGRWDAEQLNKTEKTHVGTLIQINLQKELELEDGKDLDYRIAGVEVDCKWSRLMYGWEIPTEMYEKGPQVALVVWGSDYTSRWAIGLIRISEAVLKPMGKQRDRKRQLSEDGRRRVLWMGQGDLVENTLLHLSTDQRRRILGQRSGQQSVNSLFRELPGILVNRATVLTAAQQDDCLKRVRDARKHLRSEGFVIFGHYAPHPELAAMLGLPRPTKGRFVSARLTPVEDAAIDTQAVELQGSLWRLARPGDPPTTAPALPAQGRESE
jgi:hypothetical protein